jgi:hypothetical protein
MTEDNRKDQRKQKFTQKTYKKPSISEEQRFVSKSKKMFKKEQENLKAEELWEDWENEIY